MTRSIHDGLADLWASWRLAAWGLLVAALVMLFMGCAFYHGHIPATSTPLREQRYLRTQDAANAAAGVVADELLRFVIKGPSVCTDTTAAGAVYQRACRDWAPVWRLGIVTALGGVRRATDRGYRESGWLFNVGGAVGWETIRCFFSRGCVSPQRLPPR